MRYSRQSRILELISEQSIGTQQALVELLQKEGFDVTQATVSRDIKNLHLVKVLGKNGSYQYAVPGSAEQPLDRRLSKIFRETIHGVIPSGNLIVVKTLSGCGNAAGEALDSMGLSHIIGSIAGDNTILLVVDDPSNTAEVVARITQLTK